MNIKEKIIRFLHERREDIYRFFYVGKFKFKIFSHKYAVRELQAEIKELYEDQKRGRLEIQKMNQNITEVLDNIINSEKKIVGEIRNDNVFFMEKVQKEYASIGRELQCEFIEKYNELINLLNEMNVQHKEE